MLQESLDLRAEADEFHSWLKTLGDADWGRPTPFLGWTPWDVVAHLHYFDRVAVLALTDADAFAAQAKELIRAATNGVSGAEHIRRELGALDAKELLQQWYATCYEMTERLGTADVKRRIPWFGPDMGVRMFTTARYMETWAHAQDIYDLMRTPRTHTDRIRNIAVIGVKTFVWTFLNRGLEVPGAPPYVRLVAPSGAIWEWNEPSDESRVAGDALDFCRVVTQGRNIADTALDVMGDTAAQWMAIAQCFAGGPVDPPKAGARAWEETAR
jgi:uncharacterized protein (TIGR03084 family)